MNSPRFRRHQRLQNAQINSPPLKRGERSDGVRVLQRALIDLGFSMPISMPRRGADPDGIFGAETEAALISFQRKAGLTPDGVAGAQTLGRLDSIFRVNDPFYSEPSSDNPDSFAYLKPKSITG